MYNFILQILIMSSLAVMIYLLARRVPQIIDTVSEESLILRERSLWGRVDRFISKFPMEKIDFTLSQFLEKIIRKMKLLLMRIDNYLSRHLEKFKKIKHSARRNEEKRFHLYKEVMQEKEIPEEVRKDIEKELLRAAEEAGE